MIFWLLACSLVALVVIYVLLPMMRDVKTEDALAFSRDFYRDREAELRVQLEAGDINQRAFDLHMAEQGRRLIAAAKAQEVSAAGAGSTLRRKVAAALMLAVVPLLGIGLYLKLGRPGMPDAPLVARQVAPKDFDIATAIQKIEAHLAKNPDDGRGFEVVAPVYLKAGRFNDAAHAWRRVIALLGENAQRQADLGEALVGAAEGVVSAEARKAFEAALRLEANLPKASYYLAMALDQDGRKVEAIAAFEKLRDSLPESPARVRVVAEIERLKGKGDAAADIAALPENERAQAIGGMVDGLEARLFAEGGSAEEWLKLVRAQLVLGRKEKALAAIEKARLAFKDKPEGAEVISTLEGLARNVP